MARSPRHDNTVARVERKRASEYGAELREAMRQASIAARGLLSAMDDAPEPWPGAHRYIDELAMLTDTLSGISKTLTLSCYLVASEDPIASKDPKGLLARAKEEMGTLHKLFEVARPILRPDRKRGPGRARMAFHRPTDAADLCRDLLRAPLSAFHRFPWSAGEPEHLGDVDATMKLERIPREARLAWLTRVAWNEAPLGAVVDLVLRMLESSGRLLKRRPPADLRERLASTINRQRERANARRSEGDPENFLRAVLRAYGLTASEAKSVSRVK